MSRVTVTPRAKESELFGVPIYSAAAERPADLESILAAFKASAGNTRSLLVLRVPADAMPIVQRIESAGGRLCDALVTFHKQLEVRDPITGPADPLATFRMASPADATSLLTLGLEAFHQFNGHWHADDLLDRDACDRLYGQWASDLALHGNPERPVIVRCGPVGEIQAFLALARDANSCWSVPLTAVDRPHRGKGLLRELLIEGMRYVARQGYSRMHYETQLSNQPAIRVISQLGFTPLSSRFTLHVWTGSQ